MQKREERERCRRPVTDDGVEKGENGKVDFPYRHGVIDALLAMFTDMILSFSRIGWDEGVVKGLM
ncbi:hypothetical protein M5K25_005441 [Dendrobium thyrsiflorum]|uniref:Uncharacterized protein n=1 Tax=Dendrobium thyrsiflorum TaxID=117978 RepID=A0ABD0VQ05_DENTH